MTGETKRMELILRRCTAEDIDTLCSLSRETYYETFKGMCSDEDMNAYLAQAYDRDKLLGELNNADSLFFFLYADGELAGYLKLNEAPSQSDINDSRALELERIYVSGKFQGHGFGRYLMEQALHIARERSKDYVWLGVWEKNERALRFYGRNGFYKMGTHSFVMGEDVQNDYIMRRDM